MTIEIISQICNNIHESSKKFLKLKGMDMKRGFMVFLCLLIAVSLAACGGSDGAGSAGGTDGGGSNAGGNANGGAAGSKPLIGVAMNAMDNMRVEWLNQFKISAEAAGYELVVTNADGSPETQISDIDTLITKGCDVIVVTPTSHGASATGVDAIAAAGKKSIIIDFTAGTDSYDCWYGGQTVTSGTIVGEYFNSILPKGETLNIGVIIGTWAITTTQERNDLLQAACPGLNIMVVAEGGFSADGAMTVMEDWIQAYPDMQAVYCHNDAMATGAIQALNAAGISTLEGGFIVAGTDGDEIAIPYLESGELAATAKRDYVEETNDVIELIGKLLAGEPVEKDIRGHQLALLTRDDY